MYETTLPESVHHVGLGDSNSNVPNYSNIINENIIAIKLDLKFAKNNVRRSLIQIENIDAQVVSKPIIESIRSTLQNIFDTVISTEKLFAT